MAWSFVGVGNSTAVSSGNITLVEPSGIAQGDLMVACIAYRDTAAFTVPGDWNLVATQQSSGNTTTTVVNAIASGLMMWCVRGASAPTLTISRTLGDVAVASIVAYRGAQSSPYDTGTANTLGTVSLTVTTGTLTTAEAGELIVAMAAGADNVTWSAFDAATDPTTASGATDTTTAPTAGTWIERRDAGSNLGGDTSLGIADAIRATAGATGTIQATASGTNSRHVMIAGAFKPSIDITVTGETLTATPTLTDGSVTGTASVTGETLSATGLLLSGVVSTNTSASELLKEDGSLLLQEDGYNLILEGAAGDVTVSGEILTVTASLISGVVSTNTAADELLQEDGFLILQEDGYNIVLDVASGDVTVTGETLTATPSLIDGSVTGTAEVTGETLTATPSLIDGSVTADANVTGETLTATPALIDGAVTGTAVVTGETLTATPSLIDGSVTADANVTGETLTVTPSLIDGAVTANADVTGETLTATPSLIDGDVIGTAVIDGETLTVTGALIDGGVTTDGNVSVAGETLTVTPTLIDGDVTGDANVDGETLTATPEFIEGTVTADASVTISGETLVVSVILLDGVVTVVGAATKPPGGDDAPRSHVGIAPKRVKDKYEKRGIDREDIEEIYNRIHGIEPQTKAGKRAIAAVQKAVAPGASELPPTLDWVAIDNDLKAVIAIRKAWQVIRDEEDAVIALLLAA